MMRLTINGSLTTFHNPLVMGIVNTTPDSFYEGSRASSVEAAIALARKHIEEGAKILDIGGYSTRPGAADVSVSEEIERVIPVVKALAKKWPHVFLSVDTFRAEVASQALANGGHIINDVSANKEGKMAAVAQRFTCPYIIMHNRGNPKTMMDYAEYTSVTAEVCSELAHQIHGIRKTFTGDLLVDPGFGFAKNDQQNMELLRELPTFKRILDLPVLVGLSRKSTLQRLAGLERNEVLPATTTAHTLALLGGADILRVHDVGPAKQAIAIVSAWKKKTTND